MANKFDIHIQLLPEADQRRSFKFMTFGYAATLGVKGFSYLINLWLKCFLTVKGSDPTDIEYGTSFIHLLGSNTTMEDARDFTVLSIEQCNEQIVAIQQQDTSLTASERLASAALTNFEERPEDPGFHAWVEIQNQAGERLKILLPDYGNI